MRRLSGMAMVLALAGLVGCATTPRHNIDEFSAVLPAAMTPPPKQNGAIFQAGYEMALFEDIRARRIGDILTVVLSEKTDATKTAATNTSKDTDIEVDSPVIFGQSPSFNVPRPFGPSMRGLNLSAGVESEQSFAGAGDSSQRNSLTGNITVTVAQVLPNGNLMVRGQKRLTINQGDEYVQISGMVRPADIRPDNTVLSTQVADARIAYIGDGALADANAQGWLGRFFNSKWWPF